MNNYLSLYVHIPFCVKKCAYCDFLSAPADEHTQNEYVDALLNEIKIQSLSLKNYVVQTVFFGGGTPTVLSGEVLVKILQQIKECFKVAENGEISIECNPGTTDFKELQLLLKGGFNRLSIGLQSTDDTVLKRLGRIHSYKQFLQVYADARLAGFSNINVDLMSAIPGQTEESLVRDLERITGLSPEHISTYSLMIEEGTPFYALYHEAEEERNKDGFDRKHLLPTEEEERAFYEKTRLYLSDKGYERYEISNYAKDGFACRHNRVYWERGEYLGLGLGASSFVHHSRWKNTSILQRYMEYANGQEKRTLAKEEYVELTKKEEMEEFMFLGLRQMKGVSEKRFEQIFGENLSAVYGKELEKLIQQCLLEKSIIKDDTRYSLTLSGINVSNYVFGEFIK